tara:strand:+ start:855 stop:1049 length:195 start_codon:yes stop_codon:yes gene_type:complete
LREAEEIEQGDLTTLKGRVSQKKSHYDDINGPVKLAGWRPRRALPRFWKVKLLVDQQTNQSFPC